MSWDTKVDHILLNRDCGLTSQDKEPYTPSSGQISIWQDTKRRLGIMWDDSRFVYIWREGDRIIVEVK